jgi:hypothetical protein
MTMNLARACCALLVLCALSRVAPAQKAPAAAASEDVLRSELNELRVENEQLRALILKMDNKPAEKNPDRTPLWALLATAILGVATLWWNMRNASLQSQLQAKLKALDVVVAANGPESARERLKIVESILGHDLFDPALRDGPMQGMGQGHNENRKALISMLMEYPNRQDEVLGLWKLMFPKGNLALDIARVEKSIGSRQTLAAASSPAAPAATPAPKPAATPPPESSHQSGSSATPPLPASADRSQQP